jgi:hypothetical protein
MTLRLVRWAPLALVLAAGAEACGMSTHNEVTQRAFFYLSGDNYTEYRAIAERHAAFIQVRASLLLKHSSILVADCRTHAWSSGRNLFPGLVRQQREADKKKKSSSFLLRELTTSALIRVL